MNDFIAYLADRKARYYVDINLPRKHAETRSECLERVKIHDEYLMLLDVIDHLPNEQQQAFDATYSEALAFHKSKRS